MSEIEFDPVDHITVGAVGPPGERVFMIQARKGSEVATLVVEKTQVVGLGSGGIELLSHLGRIDPEDDTDMSLDERAEPLFRVQEITLTYEDEKDMVLIEFKELTEEEETPQEARFWITLQQLGALARRGLEVAAQGRPTCPHCGLPIDPSGHACPAGNGHRSLEG